MLSNAWDAQLERFESWLRDGPSHAEGTEAHGWSLTCLHWAESREEALASSVGLLFLLLWSLGITHIQDSSSSQLIFSEMSSQKGISHYIPLCSLGISQSNHIYHDIQFTDGWSKIYTPGTADKLCCPVELSLQPVDLRHTWETEPAKQPPAGYPGQSGARKCRGI